MHRTSLLAASCVLVLLGCVFAGCSASDIQGTPLEGVAPDGGPVGRGDAGGGASRGGAGGCVASPPPAQDPSTLPSCCTDGAAHCVPASLVPSADQQALGTCGGGYCVPDPFITDPSYLPPKCTAFDGTPGACLSVCVPQVAQYKSILTQGSCAATELCAPCTNPLTRQPSGACEFAPPTACPDGGGGAAPPPATGGDAGPAAQCPYAGPPLIDPDTLPACGTAGAAHCLQSALVPAAMQAKLATCSGGYCVPDVFIASGGNFVPPSCASLDSAEGRCLNLAIPQVASQQSQLTQSTCAIFERCVPCFSPLDGTSTGACDLSCDPGPTRPIVLFASCCEQGGQPAGKCVPTAIIPSAEQKNLGQSSCAKDSGLCVPDEMLSTTFSPPACKATGFLVGAYTGVCLSKCLSFGIQGVALAQGTCDGEHTCAPCTNPLTGQPSGAPGCP